jgi:hypothetical protein
MTADLLNFEKELQNIESILLEKNISRSGNYKDWYNYFVKIYGKAHTNLHLYTIHSLICFIAHLFVAKYVLNQDLDWRSDQFSSKALKNLNKTIKEKFEVEVLSEIDYFLPFFNVLDNIEPKIAENLARIAISSMNSLDTTPEYIFDVIVQKLLSSYIRHKSGEFYTPPFKNNFKLR